MPVGPGGARHALNRLVRTIRAKSRGSNERGREPARLQPVRIRATAPSSPPAWRTRFGISACSCPRSPGLCSAFGAAVRRRRASFRRTYRRLVQGGPIRRRRPGLLAELYTRRLWLLAREGFSDALDRDPRNASRALPWPKFRSSRCRMPGHSVRRERSTRVVGGAPRRGVRGLALSYLRPPRRARGAGRSGQRPCHRARPARCAAACPGA